MTQPNDQEPRNTNTTSDKPSYLPWRFILLLVALAGVLVFAQSLYHGNVHNNRVAWLSNYDQASKEAAVAGKPMLVFFSADWCTPCKQLKAWVFSDQEVADTIMTEFIPVMIDLTNPGEYENNLANRYEVQGIPALFVTHPDGTLISQTAGYTNKEKLTAWLAQARDRFSTTE